MSSPPSNPKDMLKQPLKLPCGAILKNRLIKSPMSDSLGDGTGNPTKAQIKLYEKWAHGGVALSLIGEVQCDHRYPEKPGNLVLLPDADPVADPGADPDAMSTLALRGGENGSNIWPQLGHAGALAHSPISTPKGPSALDIEGLKCEAMSLNEIRTLPETYAQAAKLANKIGFGGVQIHAAHGFLFSQFLSPLFNHRTDSYGGVIENRFRIIRETIDAVRQAVGSSFPISIRINSTDKIVGGLSNDEALKVVYMLKETSIDLIDISGGTYFPGAPSSSDEAASSGPYYLSFAKRAKTITDIPIMVTGGFKTQAQAIKALEDGSADAIGLARAMVLNPCLANIWLSQECQDPQFPIFDESPPGGVTAWYSMRLTALGEDSEGEFNLSAREALQAYEARDEKRCVLWKGRFL